MQTPRLLLVGLQ